MVVCMESEHRFGECDYIKTDAWPSHEVVDDKIVIYNVNEFGHSFPSTPFT